MKYRALEAEMLKKNIKRKDLAKLLRISYGTMNNKLNCIRPFNDGEMFEIKKILKTDLYLDDLFKKEE